MHAAFVRARPVREDAPEMLDARRLQHEELKLAESLRVVRTRPQRRHLERRGSREPDERQPRVAAECALRFRNREVVPAWNERNDEHSDRERLNH